MRHHFCLCLLLLIWSGLTIAKTPEPETVSPPLELTSGDCAVTDADIYSVNQTSATMMMLFVTKSACDAPLGLKSEATKKKLLMQDIYIKARSYSILNKFCFWLSVVSGLCVLIWPSLTVIFKHKLDRWEWIKSATVQTTVTAIAALMFSLYAQYKDKQTYAETLMRYVMYSNQPVVELSVKVTEELAKIDRGFSFNSILGDDNN